MEPGEGVRHPGVCGWVLGGGGDLSSLEQLLMTLVLGPNVFVWIHQDREETATEGMKGPQESWLTASQRITGKDGSLPVKVKPAGEDTPREPTGSEPGLSCSLGGVTLTKALAGEVRRALWVWLAVSSVCWYVYSDSSVTPSGLTHPWTAPRSSPSAFSWSPQRGAHKAVQGS